jgi:hypothetical protein
MKIKHEFSIELDIATVPAPDLEDDATLKNLKRLALDLAARQIDNDHAKHREDARAAGVAREGVKGEDDGVRSN